VPLEEISLEKHRKRILIVDDDETILHMLKGFFIRKGFQVSVSKDVWGAMEKLKVENPTIVLTDLKMPSFSGIDLIQFILQTTKETPIVVMTAYPYLYPEKRNGDNVKAYFVKPFDIDEMYSSIERIVGD